MKTTVISTAALLCVLSPISFAKPLKVFILAGQSNMEGHAQISTLDYIGKDPLTAPILKEMRKAPIGKGAWKHSGITLDKFPSAWGEGA
jgi:alpha-galactosidase